MYAAHGLPILGMGQEHPRPDHILKASASLGERLGGQCKDVPRLPGHIQIVSAGRTCSREVDNIADTHGAGEADDRLVRRSATEYFCA